MWENARLVERPSGTWEVLGEDRPCARDEDGVWYWCALRRVDTWPIYSGVVRVPPRTADLDELMPQLEDVVRCCREMRQAAGHGGKKPANP
jgi:hypothetical protein